MSAGWHDRIASDGSPLARQRAARGGAVEFHHSLLPEAAQKTLKLRALAASAVNDCDSDDDPSARWAWYEAQTVSIKAEAERRLAILAEIEAACDAGNSKKTAAIKGAANRHRVSPRAIADWFKLVSNVPHGDRLPALAPRYKGGGKQVDIDPEAMRVLKSDYLRPERPAFMACYSRLVEEWARPRSITLPSAQTLKRRLDRELSEARRTARREGREPLRQMVAPLLRSVADLHAMQAVNIDGHTFDIFVQWEDGRIGRPILVGIQDLYSRKLLAHRIGETENTRLARNVFGDLFREWGIPAHAVLDNGRAFASKALTGGAKTRFRGIIKEYEQTGVLTALGVKTHWTIPFRGSSKPIERAWRDLCESIAKHPAMSGAYTGNAPDAKPENYRDRAIPIAEFRAHVTRQIAAHNARTGRRSETARGGSFDDAFAASYVASKIGRATDAHLRIALFEAAERRCHRKHGSVTIAGNSYWSPELAELRGKKVTVRFNPDNLHSDVHVYALDGRHLCTGQLQEAIGFFDTAGAERRAKLEKDFRRKVRAAEEADQLLRADQLAEIYGAPLDPAPKPKAGAHRIVRHRGQTAAALKEQPQLEAEPAKPEFIDDVLAGFDRLRIVE